MPVECEIHTDKDTFDSLAKACFQAEMMGVFWAAMNHRSPFVYRRNKLDHQDDHLYAFHSDLVHLRNLHHRHLPQNRLRLGPCLGRECRQESRECLVVWPGSPSGL